MKFSEKYIEWCDIMNQEPNNRDAIIFDSAYGWAVMDFQSRKEVEEGKEKC